ncbi:MAG: hypothetical protein LBT50_02255, partial [Prevotellaceae bacterium]|nr:hypothetical protein [Prevotellaceae bacterium]
ILVSKISVAYSSNWHGFLGKIFNLEYLLTLIRTSRNQKGGKIHKKTLFSQAPLVAQYQTYTLCPYSLIFLTIIRVLKTSFLPNFSN